MSNPCRKLLAAFLSIVLLVGAAGGALAVGGDSAPSTQRAHDRSPRVLRDVYALVGSDFMRTKVIAASGGSYTISVAYDRSAEIPDGAYLAAYEILPGTEAYESCLADSTAALDDSQELISARFFDVQIRYDGESIEPAAPVEVTISYDDAVELAEEETLSIVHFAEDGVEIIEDVEISDDGGELVYEQESFSVVGTVVTSLQSATSVKYFPQQKGNYVLVLQQGSDYYLVNGTGDVFPIGQDPISNGKVTIDGIGDYSVLADYVWAYSVSSSTNTSSNPVFGNQLRNVVSGNYIVPIVNDGYRATGLKLKDDKPGHGLHLTAKNGYLHVINFSTGKNVYIGLNDEKTKIKGNVSKESSAVKVYFANTFLIDGVPIGVDDVPIGQIDDNPWKGGTSGSIGGGSASDLLGAPDTEKLLAPNGDGTYSLSLSVTGKSKASSGKAAVDVVVVIDTSSSMGGENRAQRLTPTLNAAKDLGDSLLKNNTNGGVRIKVINFGKQVDGISDVWYTDASAYGAYVTGLGVSGTTNWQSGLYAAGDAMYNEGRADAAKVVVFLSDGEPTNYYAIDPATKKLIVTSTPLGNTGSSGSFNQSAYDAAALVARWLVDAGYSFYGIGAGDSAGIARVQNLTAYAYTGTDVGYAPSGRYYSATSGDAIKTAFESITEDIRSILSYRDVTLTDGISPMTSVSSAAIRGSAGGYTYAWYDVGEDGTVTARTDAYPEDFQTARYVPKGGEYTVTDADGTVTTLTAEDDMILWATANGYELKDNVKYTVSFTVWPSQDTYDLVADLNNGKRVYDGLSAAEKASVISDGENGYTFRTNTDARVHYTSVSKDEDGNETNARSGSGSIDEPSPQPLSTSIVTVAKKWTDSMYAKKRPDDITLSMYKSEIEKDRDYTLTAAGGWSKSVYIAPGLILTAAKAEAAGITDGQVTADGAYVVLNGGHDYHFEEPSSANYQLADNAYHPALVDGALKNVELTYGEDGAVTAVAIIADMSDAKLTAENELRGGINVTKIVEGAVSASKTFDLTVVITPPEDDGLAPFGSASAAGRIFVWYDRLDKNGDARTDYPEYGANYLEYDAQTGVFSGTLAFASGETIRFTNLPKGASYSVTETEESRYGYTTDVEYSHVTYDEDGVPQPKQITQGAVSDTVWANTENNVTVTNTPEAVDIKIRKVAVGGSIGLGGAHFRLFLDEACQTPAEGYEELVSSYEEETLGEFEIADLGPGTYYLSETLAPDGYYAPSHPIQLTVSAGQVRYAVYAGGYGNTIAATAMTEQGQAAAEGEAPAYYQFYVENSSGTVLPHTGGIGTGVYTAGGIILSVCALLGLGWTLIRRRRS